jgi:hypothetical protein
MGRLIGSVVLGYVVMSVLVFMSFTGLFLVLGSERSFQPGSYEASMLWIAVSTVLGVLAAVAGGWTCAVVARGARGPRVLAGVVIVLGLILAIPVITARAEPALRSGEVTNMEAMQNARQPVWVALLNPFLGAVAVMLGARLSARPPRSTPPPS